VPFSLVQEKLRLASSKWNFYQEHQQSVTGQYLPISRIQGRIYNSTSISIRGNYSVLPEAFVRFAGSGANPGNFMTHIPLNTDFMVYVIEAPNGGGGGGFATFDEMLPHTRAGLYGKIDACGVLKVTGIILNGRSAPYSSWLPQRGIMRVLNVLAELVGQIEGGTPYDPVAAQRSAWRASARLPQPQPPYFRPVSNVSSAANSNHG
jgi:hypothetical protein